MEIVGARVEFASRVAQRWFVELIARARDKVSARTLTLVHCVHREDREDATALVARRATAPRG